MYTCRRCLCINCKDEGCNCQQKRLKIVKRSVYIFWVIGGLKRKEVAKRLSEKFNYYLLEFDKLMEVEKQSNEKFGERIKFLEEKEKPIDSDILAHVFEKFINQTHTENIAGYIVESIPDLETLKSFERAVGSINVILNVLTSHDEHQKEFKEEVLKAQKVIAKSSNQKNSKVEKKNSPEEITNTKLKRFYGNLSDIKNSCYGSIVKDVKAKDDSDSNLFENADKILTNFLNAEEEKKQDKTK